MGSHIITLLWAGCCQLDNWDRAISPVFTRCPYSSVDTLIDNWVITGGELGVILTYILCRTRPCLEWPNEATVLVMTLVKAWMSARSVKNEKNIRQSDQYL